MNLFSFLFRKKAPVKTVLPRSRHKITHKDIDPGVLSILYRLKEAHYDAYLVGGCVRDLLLGCKPKDFDVVTNARPRQIKDLFRRCRLIGRRFRLAHVYLANNRIIEVATFRGLVDPGEIDMDDRFAANNVFGTIEEDAIRRDFTVNSLFFDFRDSSIVDFTGGLSDIRKKVLRSINDPEKSFPEDPVRIVRACRFAAMLDLKLSPRDHQSALRHAGLLAKANPSRMLEELRKILRSGSSAETFRQMEKLGVLRHWIPEQTDQAVFGPMISRLEILDRRVRLGESFSEPLMLTVLFYDLFRTAFKSKSLRYQDAYLAIRQNFKSVTLRLQLPKWEWFAACEIAARQEVFALPPDLKRPSRFYRWFVNGQGYKDSFILFAMDLELKKSEIGILDRWREAEKHLHQPQTHHQAQPHVQGQRHPAPHPQSRRQGHPGQNPHTPHPAAHSTHPAHPPQGSHPSHPHPHHVPAHPAEQQSKQPPNQTSPEDDAPTRN